MQYGLTEEQEMLRKTMRKLAIEKIAPRAAEVDEKEEFPRDIFEILLEHGVLALPFPEEYGGLNVDLLTYCLVVEELSKVGLTALPFTTSHSAAVDCFMTGGTPEQRKRYLTRLLAGEYFAFGLTEPGAGSDVASMQTKAVLKGNDYVLNGTKCFISNADNADILMVYAKTDPGAGIKGISAFIMEKGTPGFCVSRKEKMMGARAFQSCEVVFDNCAIPKENLLGREEGKGLTVILKFLHKGRIIVAASAVGLAQGAFDYAINYAKERIQFGRPIAQFQGIQFMLADLASQLEAARQLTYRAAAIAEEGGREGMKLACMAKYLASGVCMRVTTDAVQILGAYGYMRDYPLERMMRDAKCLQILEGTSQIQQVAIARVLLEE
ncbi:MAG: acyl-CoA dehydrogenase family protein [Pseudomonadota bacterium]